MVIIVEGVTSMAEFDIEVEVEVEGLSVGDALDIGVEVEVIAVDVGVAIDVEVLAVVMVDKLGMAGFNVDVLVVNDVVEVDVKVVEMTTVTEVEVGLVDTLEEGACVIEIKLVDVVDVVVVDVTSELAVDVVTGTLPWDVFTRELLVVPDIDELEELDPGRLINVKLVSVVLNRVELVGVLLNMSLIERLVGLLVARIDVKRLLAKRVVEVVAELSVELVTSKLLGIGAETTILVDEVVSLLNDELDGGLVFTDVVELAESDISVEATSGAELTLGSVLNDALNVLVGEERIVEVPGRETAADSEEKLAIWLLDKIELIDAPLDERASTEELKTKMVEVLDWVKEPRLLALVVIGPASDVELLMTAEDACISDVESRVEPVLPEACSADMELETSDVTLGGLELSGADVVDSRDIATREDVTTPREDLISSVESDCMLVEAVGDDTESVVTDTSEEDISD